MCLKPVFFWKPGAGDTGKFSKVDCAMKDGKRQPDALKEKDIADIEADMAKKVLHRSNILLSISVLRLFRKKKAVIT